MKFRLWEPNTGDNGCMETRVRITNDSLEKGFGEGWIETCKDDVLMRTTGLKDKNNVDIYTGDILDIKANFKRLGFVIFDHGKFKVQHVEDSLFYDFTQVLSQCEIIGNVFENKELMKVKINGSVF